MPTQSCSNKIIAQTIFLGASVSSFNNSVGWGNQPSQLTVNLIDDISPCLNQQQFANASSKFNALNQYYSCVGDDCYATPQGEDFDSSKHDPEFRMLPGKLYYELSKSYSDPIVSRYWYKSDPGFFPIKTRIKPDGSEDLSGKTYQYDIIDTPVYFKMGDFSFCGLVQSWSHNQSSGGKGYSVIINSLQSLLNSSYIILDKYAGTIFSKRLGSSIGSPKNYTGSLGANYYGSISEGNIPNVFNVYGFLESMGAGSFGVARPTNEGISVNKVLQALSVLTSALPDGTILSNTQNSSSEVFSNFANKLAFSPYGRLISKNAQIENVYEQISSSFNRFGIIAPYSNINNPSDNRCQFLLDLSDIPTLPDSVRIQGPIISIMDLLNTISEQIGHDILIETVPVSYQTNSRDTTGSSNQIYFIIKVKTISRLSQPRTNIIENTIKEFECNNEMISSANRGKEKNETNNRSMIIGGQQQRLYQAKSYRLAYTQSNFVFNVNTGSFIDYMQLGSISPNGTKTSITNKQFHHGKIKFPNFLTTRNPDLSAGYQSTIYNKILEDEDEIQGDINTSFSDDDNVWSDSDQTGGKNTSRITGNYEQSSIIKQDGSDKSTTWGAGENQRWFPIHLDTISPFFGFVNDDELNLKISNDSTSATSFRKVRPVWLDSWTGQLVVIIRLSELPETSAKLIAPYTEQNSCGAFTCYDSNGNITSSYSSGYFLITESEIRSAIAGFDNFLAYSLAKLYKPDLIEMVRKSYKKQVKDQLLAQGEQEAVAELIATNQTDWYWNINASNIGYDANAGIMPAVLASDVNDGSQSISEVALKDLQILHKFVASLGKYYGKKYMVSAYNLQSYKNEDFANIIVPTQVGYAYVFSGDGELKYNYTPVNDGAWEEYGNFIDDSIVVGSPQWYSITDEMGKIKPILGYNANYHFDNQRFNICNLKFTDIQDYKKEYRLSPYWDFESYLMLVEDMKSQCDTASFIFPTLDTSSIQSTDFILTNVVGSDATNRSLLSNTTKQLDSYNLTNVPALDAWGQSVSNIIYKQKLYATTSVEENFIFLDAENLKYPKILIDAPGISLNTSSTRYAQDPNRTVIANTSIEDVLIYMRVTPQAVWDLDWIKYMISYTLPYSKLKSYEELLDVYGTKGNSAALNIEIAPKMAHPFFVGIPIKSNQHVYGPWTNYPYTEYLNNPSNIFPDGYEIVQSDSTPPSCERKTIIVDQSTAQRAVDNWIGSVSIEMREDYVPWNYGSTAILDNIVYKEIETKVNYQGIIETAQIDMPGLPKFNLGGKFAYGNIGKDTYSLNTQVIPYTDQKIESIVPQYVSEFVLLSKTSYTQDFERTVSNTLNFKVPRLSSSNNLTLGPIITNIQVSVGQQGLLSTYSFRTYTKKLGLFNKEESDRIKKSFIANFKRNKELSDLTKQIQNIYSQQRKFIDDQRFDTAQFNKEEFRSKLFSWSPSTVLVGKAVPYIMEPFRNPPYTQDVTSYSNPGDLNTNGQPVENWFLEYGGDPGDTSSEKQLNSQATAINTLSKLGRYKASVGLYERKEVDSQLKEQYGTQAAMSLDGLLSPVSFYPTLSHSTYNFSLYDTESCPFCKGTKVRSVRLTQYFNNQKNTNNDIRVACDKCTTMGGKLNAKLKIISSSSRSIESLPPYIITSGTDFSTLINLQSLSSNSSSSTKITYSNNGKVFDFYESSITPINLVSLNPITVPMGEFRNPNMNINDRGRHSIEIVARGSVNQNNYGYNLETSKNLSKYNNSISDIPKTNLDYYDKDIILKNSVDRLEGNSNFKAPDFNMRFFALRGPLTVHGWGYDTEGYPVPNAADEPLEIDNYGRPKRFERVFTYDPPQPTLVRIDSLSVGDTYVLPTASGEAPKLELASNIYSITFNQTELPEGRTLSSLVYKIIEKDNIFNPGGFDPLYYNGSIISKTQEFIDGKWTAKTKLREFYLNWAERPDLWPVGPIDLRWDNDRKIWSTQSAASSIYKFVYVTLEEDLVKDPDYDETYPARGFLDDIEYSKESLPSGYRRLVYIRDKTGYTAPRGIKLLCRYDSDSGYYEPISKPNTVAPGQIISGNTASLEMAYTQGRKSGQVPVINITFDNSLFNFSVVSGRRGLFSYLNGKWTLTSYN